MRTRAISRHSQKQCRDLFRQNNSYVERLEALEETGDAWHEGFEGEARRLTEQAFLALSDNIESNAMQLEAVNLALRYQRAEMQAVRSAFKSGEIEASSIAPPPLDLIDRPHKPILPEWRKSVKEIEPHTDDSPEPTEEGDEALDEHEHTELTDEPNADNVPDPGETVADNDDDLEHSSTDSELTFNAGATSVETLDFDALSEAAVVGKRDSKDGSAVRSGTAADEFRRSKQERQSIFRQKRR